VVGRAWLVSAGRLPMVALLRRPCFSFG